MGDTRDRVIDFTSRRLKKEPVVYTVVVRHDEEGMSFVVDGIQDSTKDRLAVARDLQTASALLKSDAEKATSS